MITMLDFVKSPDDPTVWCIANGRRRLIGDPSWFDRHEVLSEIKTLSESEIQRLPLGPPCPDMAMMRDQPMMACLAQPHLMREYLGALAVGDGIECGPGNSPLPIPLSSTVRFVDKFEYWNAERERALQSDGISRFMPIDLTDPMEDLHSISTESVDFVIASHVLDHSPNPIAAIASAHRVCRPGGKLILIVPHRDFTIDQSREVTSVEHLLLDFTNYERERDIPHYLEWHRHILLENGSPNLAIKDWDEDIYIRRHCFTPSSFHALLSATAEIARWSVASCWTPPEPTAEFYVVLQK